MLIVNFYLQISKLLLRTLPSSVELQKLEESTSSFTFCPTKYNNVQKFYSKKVQKRFLYKRYLHLLHFNQFDSK